MCVKLRYITLVSIDWTFMYLLCVSPCKKSHEVEAKSELGLRTCQYTRYVPDTYFLAQR